jgi:hypothetical protein
MFIGAINENLRAVVAEIAHRWKGANVYVGCTGNATVERIVSQFAPSELHGNDVSLYSCVLGSHLAGNDIEVRVQRPDWEWLTQYLTGGVGTIATLLLCMEMFQSADRQEVYHLRMIKAYQKQWPDLMQKTIEKVTAALDGIVLKSFFAGDVVDFCAMAPEDCVFACFPPTYNKGYERLYKKVDEIFAWDQPSYAMFDDNRYIELIETMKTKREWLTMRDCVVPELEGHLRCKMQTSALSRPVYVYSGGNAAARVVGPVQKIEPVLVNRLTAIASGALKIAPITSPQMNGLRSQYLAPTIKPAAAQQNFAVLVGEVAGAFSFTPPPAYGSFCDVYMMTDLAIRPSIYKRLSKLVLAACLSTEARALCEMQQNRRIESIGTTAFTNKPVSQKYRGLFKLHLRKEGMLNYIAAPGRWSLEEGFEFWKKNHGQTKS